MRIYTGDPTYDTALACAFAFVALAAVGSVFVISPYGRFASPGFGVSMGPRLGWFLMELPALPSFLYFFFRGPRCTELVPLIFLVVWLGHYANRAILFPLLIRSPRGAKATFSMTVVGAGWLATSLHGYLNGAFISTFATHLDHGWLTDPRFVAGIALYYASYVLNIRSDSILRNLRTREEVEAGKKVYRVPHGGLFNWVTNASYLTELTGWLGFALATWSLGGAYILALSAANLLPRAAATHRWYKERFPDYPSNRRVLVPFVW
jgi:3-oxo-5-alpha-steroid 4-dehydrogenase 1